MDLELKHLGQILAIGGLIVFGFFHLISLISPSWRTKATFLSANGQKLYESAVILALVFAAGILADDTSQIISVQRWQSTAFYDLLDRGKKLLLKNLFEVDHHEKEVIHIKPQPLYEDLQNITHKDKTFIKYYEQVKTILKLNETPENQYKISGEEIAALEAAVRSMYYAAKNIVYRNGNYFNELQEIKTRVDFTRSLVIVCVIYLPCYLVLGVWCFLPDKLSSIIGAARAKRNLILALILLYGVGIFLAGYSWKIEERSYNLRVFGYYASIVAENEKPPAAASPSP
jgi:hypothetical protein